MLAKSWLFFYRSRCFWWFEKEICWVGADLLEVRIALTCPSEQYAAKTSKALKACCVSLLQLLATALLMMVLKVMELSIQKHAVVFTSQLPHVLGAVRTIGSISNDENGCNGRRTKGRCLGAVATPGVHAPDNGADFVDGAWKCTAISIKMQPGFWALERGYEHVERLEYSGT
jgi:hypothetical protein